MEACSITTSRPLGATGEQGGAGEEGDPVTVHVSLQPASLRHRTVADGEKAGEGGDVQGVEQGGVDRATDLLGGADHRAGDTGVGRGNAGEGGVGQGDEEGAQAETGQDHGRQHDGQVALGGLEQHQHQGALEGDGRARRHQRLRAELGGAGLGLSTVRSLVTLHEGHVDIDTAPGQGATFRIVLPLYNEIFHT
ncbi:ATP-binding protein [Streptomyces sp. NPDC006175]|uniref:ATP-binding protein n=1 Tax=Streptomyces sp. NPDC006175 TaxID=3154471 RepID=UPI00339EA02A